MTVKSEKDSPEKLVIGTRGSPLALWQAYKVRDELAKISPDIAVEIREILTSGDWRPEHGEVRLEESDGGKGQFAKEIEKALLDGDIDLAVHSMKDMETVQPEGLEISCILPREDARDAFLSDIAGCVDDLPLGAVVGTASVRRGAFLLNRRPDLKIVPFRGNVQTRIDKLRAGQVDATFLACAGLKRLGLMAEAACAVGVEDMLPAVAQGAIGIEIRSEDRERLSFMQVLNCRKSSLCVRAERAVLEALDGSCHTPIGVYAVFEGEDMHLRVHVVSPDGVFSLKHAENQLVESDQQAYMFGLKLGISLKEHIPDGIL